MKAIKKVNWELFFFSSIIQQNELVIKLKWGKLGTDKRKIIFLTQHIIRFWDSLPWHFAKAIN